MDTNPVAHIPDNCYFFGQLHDVDGLGTFTVILPRACLSRFFHFYPLLPHAVDCWHFLRGSSARRFHVSGAGFICTRPDTNTTGLSHINLARSACLPACMSESRYTQLKSSIMQNIFTLFFLRPVRFCRSTIDWIIPIIDDRTNDAVIPSPATSNSFFVLYT